MFKEAKSSETPEMKSVIIGIKNSREKLDTDEADERVDLSINNQNAEVRTSSRNSTERLKSI